ncbi:hypothetical protein SJS85_00160 [Aeromonas caviae]|uniref:hypothetical protein n=1 Tax=Aeromonas caviae TaxID=648 RepID=UPI0029D50AE9|nr:hypothetical protein [Aeromonas caviae]MDX7833845.1 hypothetical protein [Aeromonas caviae]
MTPKNYTIVSGGTFRQRIPRSELPDFLTISNDGLFWVGRNRMTVTTTDEYLEMLISNTSSLAKGDHEFKITGLDEYGDIVILVYGFIKVRG